MNVLCTGGVGYFGSHVVSLLKNSFHRVFVLDNLLFRDYYDDDGVDFIRGDVTDHVQMSLALAKSKPDCVVWLAGIVGDAACAADPARARAVNVDSVRWLAETSYRGRIVYPSSCSVYGAMGSVADENAPLNPLSIYAETKIAAEEILRDRPNTYVFRLGTLHGVSRRMRFDLIVNAMTRRAVATGSIEVYGGRQHRPLLHVSDAARVLAETAVGSGTPGVYNLATENLSVLDVAQRVAAATGAAIRTTDMPYEDRRDYRVDCSRARGEFSLSDHTDVNASARDIAALLRSGRLRDPLDPAYYNSKPPEE